MRKNGKKPASTLMAERAEDEARKAQTAEMLGPQTELPGPSDGPTPDEIKGAIVGALDSGIMRLDDLVLWTRKRFGVSMEVADGLVVGEIGDVDTPIESAAPNGLYTIQTLKNRALELMKGGPRPWNELEDQLDEYVGAPVEHSCAAIGQLIEDNLLGIAPDDALKLVEPVPVAEAIASVASDRPDLVEAGPVAIACRTGIEGVEARSDARDLRQDSKRLVSVLSLLRRRKEVRDNIKEARAELKEWTDELKELDAQIDGIGNDDRTIEPAPKPASGEPEDVALPFEDPAFSEEDSEEPATPEPDGAAAALVN